MLLVVCRAGWGLALDKDRCLQILDECGVLPSGPTGLVDLCKVPTGLDEMGTEEFLRAYAEEICGARRETEARRESGVRVKVVCGPANALLATPPSLK
jgi:hypothetical protein